jgi:DivIVA domain-containing protein
MTSARPQFRKAFRGYNMQDVDQFVERLERDLARLRVIGSASADYPGSHLSLSARDIRKKEFRLAIRGYHENDVDQYLDSAANEFEERGAAG